MPTAAIISLVSTIAGWLCKTYIEPDLKKKNPNAARATDKDYYDDNYSKEANLTAKKAHKNKMCLKKPKAKKNKI